MANNMLEMIFIIIFRLKYVAVCVLFFLHSAVYV